MSIKAVNITGGKFNKLTAIKFSHSDKHYNHYWLFKCECGTEKAINKDSVKRGKVKSCGCLRHIPRVKHGYRYTKIYECWKAMRQRCLNKKGERFKRWGGRGIAICDDWTEFKSFLKDMGEKPEGRTLDRIDNDKGYYKENCRWATPKEQANNTRRNIDIFYNKKRQTLAQWCRELKLDYKKAQYFLKKNFSFKQTINKIK